MGWAVGTDSNGRDIGYGVPATCDHPECDVKIDRGLSYVCGGEPYGGHAGCGLFFCETHLGYAYTEDGDDLLDAFGDTLPQMCERCIDYHQSPDADYPECFQPKADHLEWINHKLTHESWQQWRDSYPNQVEYLRQQQRV